MKSWLLLFTLLLWQGGNTNLLTHIARTNALKREAEAAYQAKDYPKAAQLYETLITDYEETSPPILINRANALFLGGKKEKALEAYQEIAETFPESPAKSVALQQLGFMATEEKKLQEALQLFKDALKANPYNESARHNYELAYKRLHDRKNQEQQQEDQQQQQQEDQPKIEPSEWAKQQKARAEALAQQFQYDEAMQLMQQSLQQDSTVAAYSDFIKRLGDVAEID